VTLGAPASYSTRRNEDEEETRGRTERSTTVSDEKNYGTRDTDEAVGVPDAAPPEETPEEKKDDTRRTAAIGAAAGAVAGGVVAGPVGAVAGGVVGGAIGAANAADEDEPESTGDVTDDDQRRVKRTYSGEFYEEGSLKDVRRDDQV
jgi:hypothetical protein